MSSGQDDTGYTGTNPLGTGTGNEQHSVSAIWSNVSCCSMVYDYHQLILTPVGNLPQFRVGLMCSP